eukprot:scaffold132385_cov69-Phaeocystis_antarctica.AAC.4
MKRNDAPALWLSVLPFFRHLRLPLFEIACRLHDRFSVHLAETTSPLRRDPAPVEGRPQQEQAAARTGELLEGCQVGVQS